MKHIPSSGIWKGPDSPAGHEFYAPKTLADLPDCPRCKYGTPTQNANDKSLMRCADCGFIFTNTKQP